ncbi:MAG: hypothetical protein KDK70_23755, partial [Myxococcales bacterium]|nr:hypothetical protein [Myxococcales bacterium]
GHTKMMEQYVESLVSSDADLDSILYAVQTTSFLYVQMIEAAFADVRAPMDTGWDWAALRADGRSPRDFTAAKTA